MIEKKYIIFLLIFSIALFFYGCSSSSNSIRYNNNKEEKEEKDNSVRFTSKDYQEPSSESSDTEVEDEGDDIPAEEPSIDISSVLNKYGTGSNSGTSIGNSTIKEKILMEIVKYLNTPYKFGGNSKDGIDCSAFTQTIYRNTSSILLLRSAREQYTQGTVINNKADLKFGDLVFFNTRRRVKPGHVGIYIGENLFAHASSKKGVIVSSLDHEYYSRTFMGARRIDDLFTNTIN